MELSHLGPVTLQVGDLARSLDYYRHLLGLSVLSTGTGVVRLGAPDGRPLVTLQEQRGIRPAPRRGAYGLYHFAILLPDRAALGRFAAHLSEQQVQVAMADHLVSEALYLTDPDGLGIEVYADRPRSTWTYRGDELVMVSDPLDIRAVIAAGGRLPWDGMPAGTVMGHLHLHVGAIADASAFYHEALGLDRVVWTYPGALFMSSGGYHHHLAVNTWSPGPSAREDEARLLEWQLVLRSPRDVRHAADRVRAAGHEVTAADADVRMADPWGTVVRLSSV